MKEKPILFSGPMVRAILDGRKTMTRRVVKPQPCWPSEWGSPIPCSPYSPTKIDRNGKEYPGESVYGFADEREGWVCPYGQPGDRLWVREAWGLDEAYCEGVQYRADWSDQDHRHAKDNTDWKWKPSIHMPRSFSRITLEVTAVRVERVQDISAADVEREGAIIETTEINDALPIWIKLWDSINAKRGYGWDVNPWVWVIGFKRLNKGGV